MKIILDNQKIMISVDLYSLITLLLLMQNYWSAGQETFDLKDEVNDGRIYKIIKTELQQSRLITTDQNQVITLLKKSMEDLRKEVGNLTSCCKSSSVEPCPDGFVYRPYVNSCYKFIPKALTWEQSRVICAQEYPGAHLAVVTSAEEDRVIVDYLKSLSTSAIQSCGGEGQTAAYIAGQRVIDGNCSTEFVWKPNNTTRIPIMYSNWQTDQPDCHKHSGSTPESCVHYYSKFDYKWNDARCGNQHCSICEVDK